jgi:diguanylate cyclase (GGDEF)-like protein
VFNLTATAPRLTVPRGSDCTLVMRVVAGLMLALAMATTAMADHTLEHRALAIEAGLQGYPRRSLAELAQLIPTAEAAPAAERRFVYGLLGQAKVLAGDTISAADLADRLEAEASATLDPPGRAIALLIRSTIESSGGDAAKAAALAKEAGELVRRSDDEFVRHWAALALGTAARTLGHPEEALASLQDALSAAEKADNPYRRSSAQYQLSVLQRTLRNGKEALAASSAAFKDGEAAKSPFAMANAKMAESAVMELLERPAREMAAMEQALAIARGAKSQTAEARALINLADIRLRRKQYGEALDLSRRSLALSQAVDDPGLVATSKANMGFSLLGLGRIPEVKRYTDEAVADYERTCATAEIADLLGEYGRSLEQVGDYRGALGLYHRERKLNNEISLQTRQRALLEVQEKYESEKRRREIDLLNRENDLKTAEIANSELQQRIWWLLAGLFALSFVVVVVLYRKLRVTNSLLGEKNAELSVQSSRDPLTALYNRRYFQNFVAAEGLQPERRRSDNDDTVHALLLIDIDHFKETNDRFGHALGDAVLVAVAERLQETLRESDMIVRWGGEEFLVFATAKVDRIDDIAARILRAISAKPITLNDKVIRTTVSIGYLPLPLPPAADSLSWDRAIGLIDMALYMAKVNGRNRAFGLRRVLSDDSEALAAAERDLEHAWKAGLVEMHVLYGPSPTSESNAEVRAARAVAPGQSATPELSAVPMKVVTTSSARRAH